MQYGNGSFKLSLSCQDPRLLNKEIEFSDEVNLGFLSASVFWSTLKMCERISDGFDSFYWRQWEVKFSEIVHAAGESLTAKEGWHTAVNHSSRSDEAARIEERKKERSE